MAPPPTSSRRWLWVFAWLLLTLYFVTPPREVYDQTLDRSNYATYAHFITHGMQWGVDVLPMPGPLGFVLFGYAYSGELYGVRLVADLLLCAAFSAMLLNLFHRAGAGALRWCWIGVVVLVVPFVDDLLLDAAVLLSAVCLLLARADKPDRWAYLGALLLAFISLIKGTHLMMAAAVFGTVALLGMVERRPLRVVRPLAVFLLAFLIFWVLARQNPLNLPDFLVATWQLASGYSLSMGLEEHPFFFQMGVLQAIGLGTVLVWTACVGARTLRGYAVLLFIALLAFLKWKHGYVRADGHVYIFFASAAIIAMTAWLVGFSAMAADSPADAHRSPRWRSLVGLGLVTLVTTFAVLGSAEFWLPRFLLVAKSTPDRMISHARYLLEPGQKRAALDRELTGVRLATDLPQVREAIGSDTIDFLGNEEGVLLLNNFNYHPRPMGGGTFNVVNTWLQKRNESFILSPDTAPAWQLMKLAPFDDRLPTGDDGLALRAILDCYEPVLMQRDYLLLKRVRERPASATPQLLSTVTVQPGQPIAIPIVDADSMVLFSLKAPFNPYGRLRSFLYRPPVASARFQSAKHPGSRTYVLKPAMLQQPVLLSPLVEDTMDFLRLYTEQAGNVIGALTIDVAPGFDLDELSISFYSAPRPPKPTDTDLNEIFTYAKHPLHNREPVAVVTEATGIRELFEEPVSLIHAPGSITWNLMPGDQQIIFNYGIIPKAYLESDTSDGVEFNVEVLWPPTDGRVVFKRMIRPRTVHQDRGMHQARVMLPPFEPGAQLRIRTHPGPDNDGANDQSYINRVNIKSGPLVAEQFNGLGVIPANRQLPHDAVAGVDNQPVYLLHAPNELILSVPSDARTLHAEIGLLPGAYSDGGNTDGVEYTAFVETAGSSRREIWKRLVRPVKETADRGSIKIAIPLPTLPTDARIVITTGVGPNGDRSWDQSYIARVRFE